MGDALILLHTAIAIVGIIVLIVVVRRSGWGEWSPTKRSGRTSDEWSG